MNELDRQVAERIGDWVWKDGNAGLAWYPKDSVASSEARQDVPYTSDPAWWGPFIVLLLRNGYRACFRAAPYTVSGRAEYWFRRPSKLYKTLNGTDTPYCNALGEAVCRAVLEIPEGGSDE